MKTGPLYVFSKSGVGEAKFHREWMIANINERLHIISNEFVEKGVNRQALITKSK